jgi:transposase, IS5 family
VFRVGRRGDQGFAVRQPVDPELRGRGPSRQDAPDATKLFKFQRLLERQDQTRAIFEEINGHLAAQGLVLREGTIVDAVIIAVPPSTGNRAKAR